MKRGENSASYLLIYHQRADAMKACGRIGGRSHLILNSILYAES